MIKWFSRLTILSVIIVAGVLGVSFYYSTLSIHQLLTENKRLSKAIHNLTRETQIGYIILKSQTSDASGRTINQIRFVQTAPENPKLVVSEREFTIHSDIVFFDAMIVKFTDEFVKDGKERALYLCRRIYGEDTPPIQGQSLETPSAAPERYETITRSLPFKSKNTFWDSIWSLANDPEELSDYGLTAVFGNAVYIRPVPGKVYLLKISPTGQIYPEVVNDY